MRTFFCGCFFFFLSRFSCFCFLRNSFKEFFPRKFRYFSLIGAVAFPVCAQTMAPASKPIIPAATLDAYDQMGVTPGNFMVNKTGAARYSIPIFAVRGTAGVTPQISLPKTMQKLSLQVYWPQIHMRQVSASI